MNAADIARALIAADGNKTKAAAALGTSVRTLGRKIDAHHEEIEVLIAEAQNDTAAGNDSETVAPFAVDPLNPTDEELSAAIQRGLADGTLIDSADWLASEAATDSEPAGGSVITARTADGNLTVIAQATRVDITPQTAEAPAAETARTTTRAKIGTFTTDGIDAHTCVGACGRELPVVKFPTTGTPGARVAECRECRDARRSHTVKA